jgi:hypothetical protein
VGGEEQATPAGTVDLEALRARRRYPQFGPEDDDFHDEVLSERWWETETNWISWHVPDRHLSGWTYAQARPNANLCNGGVWVWDDTSPWTWDLPYHVHYSGLQLAPRAERDMRDFEWPTGVRIAMVEPLTSYTIRYDDPGALELDLRFDAIMAPNPHPVGVVPFVKGTHFDQPGHVTGPMVLHGERIPVDCLSFRDRSWGPRPMGRPKVRPDRPAGPAPSFGGVGYSFGAATPEDAWLTYSAPGLDADPVSCGFLLRAGHYGHILGGQRHITVDGTTGWPLRMEIEAVDEFGRRLRVDGRAVSRHWRGHGGDSLFRWSWDGLEGWGEDQSYFSRPVWEANRSLRAAPAGEA